VTGTEERLATGDAVNVAARLEQIASPGEALLGLDTLRLVRDRARVSRRLPLPVVRSPYVDDSSRERPSSASALVKRRCRFAAFCEEQDSDAATSGV
jgi:hypothetical protein